MVLKPIASILVAGGLIACTSTRNTEGPGSNEWVSIFDGQSLTGWTPKINNQNLGDDPAQIFRVEEGKLRVTYEDMTEFDNAFGHLFFDEEVSDYRLRFEYRFSEMQTSGGPAWAFMNSGVMFHAQTPDSMRKDQAFPISVEAQLLGASEASPTRTTANVCTPGTHIVFEGELTEQHCVASQTRAAPAGIWVSFELEVRRSRLTRLLIDGDDAFALSDPQFDTTDPDVARLQLEGPIETGYFALQAESHPVAFRNIELMRLY